eukprot:CAMPEP_0197457338 /NCGR_PEP_ID=MMETSP1175-20131217/45750_1 /TAXON_ID=1003142 /ORGANISM="Triceratium dubium, Strain CCMP147" /LENGTH=213 /DNA_ID=CAMNT_0042991673 /DNA_START=63 /DNA_END=701 /DNA_ORIENTATION=-
MSPDEKAQTPNDAFTDEEAQDSAPSEKYSPEIQEVLKLVEGGDFFDALIQAALIANGGLDVNLLIVAVEVGEMASETQMNSRGYLGVLIFMCLFGWYWLMANFVLPFTKFFARKKYYTWLGNRSWGCFCDGFIGRTNEGHHSLFHPRNCIVVNLIVSDIGFTVWSYFEAGKDWRDPMFMAKAAAAFIQACSSVRTICAELKKARKFYELSNSN